MPVIYTPSAVSMLGEVLWLYTWLESVIGNNKLREWRPRSLACKESLSKEGIYTKNNLVRCCVKDWRCCCGF